MNLVDSETRMKAKPNLDKKESMENSQSGKQVTFTAGQHHTDSNDEYVYSSTEHKHTSKKWKLEQPSKQSTPKMEEQDSAENHKMTENNPEFHAQPAPIVKPQPADEPKLADIPEYNPKHMTDAMDVVKQPED